MKQVDTCRRSVSFGLVIFLRLIVMPLDRIIHAYAEHYDLGREKDERKLIYPRSIRHFEHFHSAVWNWLSSRIALTRNVSAIKLACILCRSGIQGDVRSSLTGSVSRRRLGNPSHHCTRGPRAILTVVGSGYGSASPENRRPLQRNMVRGDPACPDANALPTVPK